MSGVRSIMKEWSAKILGDQEWSKGFAATFCFVISGTDGGTWTFRCMEPVAAFDSEKPFDCKISLSDADFIAIVERRLNPQQAYLQGQIKLEGDIQQALKLNRIFF